MARQFLTDIEVTSAATFDGTISFSLGTAALPSFYPGTDTNTGFWSPGADTLAVSTAGTEALRTDSSQRLLVGVTSGNANGGVLQLKSGITFPATQVASADANTLDDYEEGSFTPTIFGATTAGTGTYSQQVGRYTKIGNLVNFSIQLSWSAHTGTGFGRVGGLPFTTSSAVEDTAAIVSENYTTPTNTYMTCQIVANNTFIRIYGTPLSTNATGSVALDTNVTFLNITGTYRV